MPEHFEVIVVGTGFGGSVAAYRLAEAGKRVLVLERGKAYPPGSFPRSPDAMKKNFWDPSEELFGMFNVWSFRGIEALVASGLGGGSLIYANVLLRKDEKWFVKEDLATGGYEHWPVSRQDLDPHYDRVESGLNAQPFPFDTRPFRETAKTRAMQDAGTALAQKPEFGGQISWALPPLAVSFRSRPYDPANPDDPDNPPLFGAPITEPDPNLHRMTRQTCRLCGECDLGCNYGSKNTLDYTYLTAAARSGAEIRTGCDVTSFCQRSSGGYEVTYRRFAFGQPDRDVQTHKLTCDRLVLSAGTLGTTFLMLRNAANLPGLSTKRLGHRFCGNGDLLSFALRGSRDMNPSFGPVITSYLRVKDELDGGSGRGFYVEDAGYPHLVGWVMQAARSGLSVGNIIRFARRWIRLRLRLSTDSDLGAELSELIGSTQMTTAFLPLLGMGRDIPDGRLSLSKDNRLDLDWRADSSAAFFARMEKTMRAMADVWQADFEVNPTYRYLRRLITVHPLGGCSMGRSPDEGVVDKWGRVFGCDGLFIADGSVMPGPVGPNPALTIAALADRFADHMIDSW